VLLQENPKLWTPTQLSLYLTSSLRFRKGGAIPLPVAKDIAAWVMREKLGGKRFLRLTEANLSEFVSHYSGQPPSSRVSLSL
jgi:hypothetical protein